MTTVEAALVAMDVAEQEAREHLAYKDRELEYGAPLYVEGWARARLRLIARDRATLERHTSWHIVDPLPSDPEHICGHCTEPWPCPDARAVADYWQEETDG